MLVVHGMVGRVDESVALRRCQLLDAYQVKELKEA
jgi:hypothetical protein